MEEKEFIEKVNKLIDEKNGFKVSGMGMLAENTKKLNELMDRNNFLLSMIEKKLDRIIEKLK